MLFFLGQGTNFLYTIIANPNYVLGDEYRCFVSSTCTLTILVGNNFSGDDVFFEFTDAFGIIWSENSYPKDACYKNNDDDSTFRSASGLPPSC